MSSKSHILAKRTIYEHKKLSNLLISDTFFLLRKRNERNLSTLSLCANSRIKIQAKPLAKLFLI